MSKKIKSIKIIDPGASPDVDTDFATFLKAPALDYVAEKYGAEKVAAIITPGPFKNKNAWKSVASTFEVPTYLANQISDMIPDGSDGTTISDLLDSENPNGADLRDALETHKLTKIAEYATKAQNRARETGVHACGVIISSTSLDDTIPVQIREDGVPVTQWNYYNCEDLGLIKMDFLGLDTVDLIYNTVNTIEKTKGIKLDMEEIINGDLNDPKVYELFQKGDTDNIFQFSGDGVKQLLRDVKPTEFTELAALTALYRPGPMSLNLHHDFALRKKDEKARIPVHKDFYGTTVEEILSPNLNALVYQEDIMKIARQCAGFTAREADDLRKAIGKKNMDLMRSLEGKFKEGMLKNGYKQAGVNLLWEGFVGFGQYAFNLSHATSYALNSYQAAYLKAHYPTEFIANVLKQKAKSDKTAEILSSAKAMGITVGTPDINESGENIDPAKDDYKVVFGFSNVKGLPKEVIHEMIEERNKNGKFKSVEDFIERTVPLGMSPSTFIKLVQVGAFDSMGYTRKGLELAADLLFKNVSKKLSSKPTQTTGLFAMIGNDSLEKVEISTEEHPFLTRISNEAALIGAYLTGNPLDKIDVKQTDKEIYLSFLTLKGKTKFGRRIFEGVIDDGNTTTPITLPKDITNRIIVHESIKNGLTIEEVLDKRKIYEPSERERWYQYSPIPMPELFKVYKATYKKGWNGTPMLIDLKPVPLDNNGERVKEIWTTIADPETLKQFVSQVRLYTDKYHDNKEKLKSARVYLKNGKHIDVENVLLTEDLFYDLRSYLKPD